MQIDPRTSDSIETYLKVTAPNFLPTLESALQNGYGKALARIFSEMVELVVKRINKVPDNNFLAYLDVLGVKLLPPQPSVVPVVFKLSTGAPEEGVEIPANTSVVAGDIHFETDKIIWVIPQIITAGFVYLSARDTIFIFPDGIQNGIPIEAVSCKLAFGSTVQDAIIYVNDATGLKKGDQIIIGSSETEEYATISDIKDNVLKLHRKLSVNHDAGSVVLRNERQKNNAGENVQSHALYIGHTSIFNAENAADLRLRGASLTSLASVFNIWEYWTGNGTAPDDWVRFASVSVQGTDLVLHKETGEIKKSKVNGIENRWIRCRATGDNIPNSSFSIALSTTASFVQTDPDLMMYNDTMLSSEAAPILPFGTRPRQHDTLYLASRDAFSKPGLSISMHFLKFGTDTTDKTPLVVWEYWNGKNWTSLFVSGLRINSETEDFNLINGFDTATPRTISFACPADFAETEVAGKVNYWIRLRIAAGDYGNDVKWVAPYWIPDTIKTPKLTSVKISWENGASLAPEVCYVENNCTFKNITDQIAKGNQVAVFERLSDTKLPASAMALFFGFNGRPQNGPVSLYFALSHELPLSRSLDNPVVWYCSKAGSAWSPLDTIDNTHNLTRSGTIEFLFPSDFESIILFGKELFWIQGCFGEQVASDTPAITAVYTNTAMAMQAESIRVEILGGSSTDPDQKFHLLRSPVIDCHLWVDEINSVSEAEKSLLAQQQIDVKEEPGRFGINGKYWVHWNRSDDFLDSNSTDRHYTLDVTNGEIQFGDGVHGMIPPPGKGNIMVDYTVGGGKQGNVPAGAITTLKSSVRYVDRVYNPVAAEAGADAETVEAVIQRGPSLINHRNRAVTQQDFERLAAQASPDIRRTKCYTRDNIVHIIVVPDASADQPVISLSEREKIEQYLVERCLNTVLPINILVQNPEYSPIHTHITIIPRSMELAVAAQTAVKERLRRYFHPLTGGSGGTGWEFGRTVRISDLYAVLGNVAGVDYVKEMSLGLSSGNLGGVDVEIGEFSLVCSGTHLVTVTMEG